MRKLSTAIRASKIKLRGSASPREIKTTATESGRVLILFWVRDYRMSLVFKIDTGEVTFINQKGMDMLRESWNVENLKFEPRTMEELRKEWHLY